MKNILEKHLELIPGLTDGRWEKVQSSNLIFPLLNSSFEMTWITNCIVRKLHKEYNPKRIRRVGSETLPISWRYYRDGLVRQPQTPNGLLCIKKGLAHHAKWDAVHLYDTKAAWQNAMWWGGMRACWTYSRCIQGCQPTICVSHVKKTNIKLCSQRPRLGSTGAF